MKLAHLLTDFLSLPAQQDRDISGLSLDSRQVSYGHLFLAFPGEHVDGRDYIGAAIQKGAVAVLCEAKGAELKELKVATTIPLIYIENLQDKLSHLASIFYAHPSQKMTVIGVTGTNGKTSICHYLAQILGQLAKPCAVLGTVGNGFLGNLQTAKLTTPDAIEVQRLLAEYYQQGAEIVVMEVSSHSLIQARVAAVAFEGAVFTNLSQDHLDYHGTMHAYGQAKHLLFKFASLKYVVLNADDPFSAVIMKSLSPTVKPYIYSLINQESSSTKTATLYAESLHLNDKKLRANIQTPWGQMLLESDILGDFTISNLLAVLGVLGALEIPLEKLIKPLNQLKAVPGRMDRIGGNAQWPLIIVDYAHTPDALEKVLSSLRAQCSAQLWCVFGCGGERDLTKRPLMAKAAERYADQIIVTDDNPRHEDPQAIVADILAGFKDRAKLRVEHDREAALAYAIHNAQVEDYILIAGKGHETYQLIGDCVFEFNDKKIVEKILGEDSACHQSCN